MEKRIGCLQIYSVIITLLAVIFLISFARVYHMTGLDTKLLLKLGFEDQIEQPDWNFMTWDNCLQKLDYKADVVFFGDSLTRQHDFSQDFKNVKVITVGHPADSLGDMFSRIPIIKTIQPKKIFVMGGLIGLTDNSDMKRTMRQYATVLQKLHLAVPDAEIYVQSILPISQEVELARNCHNLTITKFNNELKQMALENGYKYIELNSLYSLNGVMNPKHTTDGLHLKPESYQLWVNAIRDYVKK